MSQALKHLLEVMRQHPGYQDFLREWALQPLSMPRYKKGESLEDLGARTAYASGQRDQHDKLMIFLTGQPASQDTDKET